ncbi:hypothetical protein DYB37_013139, partial [Aphanomyces astaci]
MAELKQLKLMLLAQKQEINDLRAQPTEPAKPNGLRSVESDAKDLLRKVKFNGKYFSAFKVKFQDVCQLRHIWDIIDGSYVLPDDAAEVKAFAYEDSAPAEMWRTLVSNYETKEWSNTICVLRYDPKTDITRVRATIRELVDMGKAMTKSEVVEWLAKGIEDMTLEINALQPRLTELSDKIRKTGDNLLWCYICKKKGDHEAMGQPGYDPNYLRHWHNKLNHTDMQQVAKIIQPILLPGIDSSTTNHICDGSRTVNHELFTSMFIDQASRYIFGKLLKTKDDVILHLDALVSDLNSQLPHA